MTRILLLLAAVTAAGCDDGDKDDDGTITGVCLYAGDGPLAPTCMNRWSGEISCKQVQGEVGLYEEGTTCSDEGFPYPCTSDSPDSLWVAAEADCEAWTGGDTGAGDDTGGMGDGPCGESGIGELTLMEATGECGDEPVGSTPVLSATAPATGQVALVLENATVGCCPTVDAQASASLRTSTIDATNGVSGDDCDCVCALDISLRFTDVPAGTFTVHLDGHDTTVKVP